MSVLTTYKKLRIVKIMKKKQSPSRYGRGKTFTTITFRDERNRKIKAMGRWTENWQEGDVVEGLLKSSAYENDWGTITVSYYFEKIKESYDEDEMDELYFQEAVTIVNDVATFKNKNKPYAYGK